MRIKFYVLPILLLGLYFQARAQSWKLLQQGKGLSYSNTIPFFWPGSRNEVWPGIGIPYPLLQIKSDTAYSYFKPETDLNPYSNPLIGAYPWKGKTYLLHGFLPAYQMGIFGQCNGGVLIKNGNQFSLKNSINSLALFGVKEKFWYHSAKPQLDSSVWIAADTGFRRINLNTLETKILKDESYKGIALYNHMAAHGNRWAGFRNDYGIWCIVWGDTNARILTGMNLGIGPNRFVFDLAETPANDTVFTASDFLGNLQSPYRLYKRNQGQITDLSAQFPILGDSLTFVETEKNGTIWVTGRKRELFQIRGNEVRKILLPDSLKDIAISQLAIDEGNLKWIGLQDRGLLRLCDVGINPVFPPQKRLCMGDTFTFQANAQTLGRGIVKVKWDFGFKDTLIGERVKYACTRPGKFPIRITVWDENGSWQTFTDSLRVDYPVASVIQSQNHSRLFCQSKWLWTDSPFSKVWTLPNGTQFFKDSLLAVEDGKYILTIQNGACARHDTVELNASKLSQVVLAVRSSEKVLEKTIITTLPIGIEIGAGPMPICNPLWYENGAYFGNENPIERTLKAVGMYVYRVEGEGLGGCRATGQDTLWVKDLKNTIPNLITANGDQKNDLFEILGTQISNLTLYNRWGREIFSASPYQNNWPTSEVSPGTYFYRLEAGGKSFTGWVMVER